MSARFIAGAEEPELHVNWLDDIGVPVDFSTGWTFVLKIYKTGAAPVLTKTSGITGAVGSLVAPLIPNVRVVWAVNDLEIAAGSYMLEIKATKAGRDRYLRGQITIWPRAT